jgi:hypothetical protein
VIVLEDHLLGISSFPFWARLDRHALDAPGDPRAIPRLPLFSFPRVVKTRQTIVLRVADASPVKRARPFRRAASTRYVEAAGLQQHFWRSMNLRHVFILEADLQMAEPDD